MIQIRHAAATADDDEAGNNDDGVSGAQFVSSVALYSSGILFAKGPLLSEVSTRIFISPWRESVVSLEQMRSGMAAQVQRCVESKSTRTWIQHVRPTSPPYIFSEIFSCKVNATKIEWDLWGLGFILMHCGF